MQFQKPAISIQDQLALLKARGLQIQNDSIAEHFLSNISYYRLAGYWWSLQADKVNHLFKTGSTFETVINIYNFDRELRLLLFSAIERIEIGFRTRLIYQLSHQYHPYWFEDVSLFKDATHFTQNLTLIDDELKRSKEVFVTEHFAKYTSPVRPPAWKTIEILSLGHLSKLYANLQNSLPEKDNIARSMGLPNAHYFGTWIQSISLIRNLCAHHSRIWNKNLPARPRLLQNLPNNWLTNVPPNTNKLYANICCMKYLLDVVNPQNQFADKLKGLFQKYPNISPMALGFTVSWESELLFA